MPPRRRSHKNRDLEGTFITPVKSNGTTYYYYQMPDGSTPSLGKDREEAKAAAKILNEALRPAGNIAQNILEGNIKKRKSKPIDDINKVIDDFINDFLPDKNYSEKTLAEKTYKLKQYKKEWKVYGISEITTRMISKFLKPLKPDPHNKHRILLINLFGFAISEGYMEHNPALVIMQRRPGERTRQKHTVEGYWKIYNIAPPWLQRAMGLAIRSLQRRSDLTGIHIHKHINMKDRTIKILQDKTRNYKKPVYIEIEMGDELYDVVNQCIKSDVPCPYIIHYRPRRITQEIRESKPHVFSVTPSYLTKQFTKYRDLSGAYDHLEAKQRPTFHDLRGLGAWLYEKAGYDEEYIMALTGHASKKTLEIYTEGHEEKKPVRVQAGLKIKKDN